MDLITKKRKETHYFWDLLVEMTGKEIRARYKNTFFGFLWVVLNPLLQMLVIGFVFKFFIKEPIQNYYLFLLVGLLVWNFFSLSMNKVTPCIVNERMLIKKARFPRQVIPLSIIFSNFIHLVIAFALVLVPILYTGLLSVNNLPSLVLANILLLIFTTGLGLLTSSLNVRFRDVTFFVSAILIVWFYATPIVYDIAVIPNELIWIWRLNPMTVIVQLFQNALVESPKPGILMFLSNFLVIIFTFVCGITVFKKMSKDFDDWV